MDIHTPEYLRVKANMEMSKINRIKSPPSKKKTTAKLIKKLLLIGFCIFLVLVIIACDYIESSGLRV